MRTRIIAAMGLVLIFPAALGTAIFDKVQK
jgi:hypothetical protein